MQILQEIIHKNWFTFCKFHTGDSAALPLQSLHAASASLTMFVNPVSSVSPVSTVSLVPLIICVSLVGESVIPFSTLKPFLKCELLNFFKNFQSCFHHVPLGPLSPLSPGPSASSSFWSLLLLLLLYYMITLLSVMVMIDNNQGCPWMIYISIQWI